MYHSRRRFDVFSFQTLIIAGAVGSRTGSWNWFLFTAIALMAIWAYVAKTMTENALMNLAAIMGGFWGFAAIFVARSMSPFSAFVFVVFMVVIGFAGNIVMLSYFRNPSKYR